jgi:hypothetical protein
MRKVEPAVHWSMPAKREGLRVTGGASLVCFLAQFVLQQDRYDSLRLCKRIADRS